jgi:hypothetical protein
MPVRAEFTKDAIDTLAKMKKGEKVTMRCDTLREAGGFLTLKECKLN